VLYLGPVRRGTVRGRTSFRVATHDGSQGHIVSWIARGAQAGIEPAPGAWAPQRIGSAKAVRNMSTQLHHPDENVILAWYETRLRRVAGPARRAADPLGACVWTILYRSGGADESDGFSASEAGSMPAWAPLRE
jgi:hypothetical protein